MFGTKVLEERKSKFNGNLRVVKTWGMGTYIQAGGLTQSGGIVESIWNSTLKRIVHSKLSITNCLILGLGGGTVAKLIRKNWPEVKITGVDIDPLMVELGKKYLDLQSDKILIQDAGKSVSGKFDLVVVDLYNGDQFPKKFEEDKFLKMISKNKRSLASQGPDKLVIFNRLRYKDKKVASEDFGKKLQKYFKKVDYYYPPANLMFICSN